MVSYQSLSTVNVNKETLEHRVNIDFHGQKKKKKAFVAGNIVTTELIWETNELVCLSINTSIY